MNFVGDTMEINVDDSSQAPTIGISNIFISPPSLPAHPITKTVVLITASDWSSRIADQLLCFSMDEIQRSNLLMASRHRHSDSDLLNKIMC